MPFVFRGHHSNCCGSDGETVLFVKPSNFFFFFFLLMDSKAASPQSAFILVRDIFREHVVTWRSTRGAAKDQGNAGSLWLNGATVSCFSLRVSNARNSEPPAMTLLPQSWVAAGFELGDMLVERKKKKKKNDDSPIIGTARRLRNNGTHETTQERARRGQGCKVFEVSAFWTSRSISSLKGKTALLNWLESEPSAEETRRTVFV